VTLAFASILPNAYRGVNFKTYTYI